MTATGSSAHARVRILIAAGGTGGHVYPGLAVAEALQWLAPETEIRFAGTRRGLEARLVPAAGYRLHTVAASGYRGLGLLARLRAGFNLTRGWASAALLLARWRADAVLGTGGYASVPLLLAAASLRIPCALQEQNARPGSANRLASRWASRIYLGSAAARSWLPAARCVVTGNPVRAGFAPAPLAAAVGAREAPAAAEPLRLLVVGGSQGARSLNRALVEAAPSWRERGDLLLRVQCGSAQQPEVAAAYAGADPRRVRVEAYIEDMAGAMRWADLVACRAGAMTLAELAASGRPAILVPFPHATDDHQLHNARDREAAGAAVVLADGECRGGTLAATVDALAGDRTRLAAMARASAALAAPDAAAVIARDLLALAGRPAAGAASRSEEVTRRVS
jgi:UDP-N-acetylglucosamine--N-acetylmuramyl-(pentapeptide) pyrophosphoryl-undecaprenol N-acetylglucosamine transferase